MANTPDQSDSRPAPHLVLVGAGHAQLFVLERLARGGFGPVRTTLVAPTAEHLYSGMLPGMIGGMYRQEELCFDLRALARAAGAELILGCAARVDASRRVVELTDGRAVHYDIVSLAIGSEIGGGDLPGVAQWAIPLKPVDGAWCLPDALDDAVSAAARDGERAARVVVAGGGAAGVEIALAVRGRFRGRFRERLRGPRPGAAEPVVTLIERGRSVIAERAPGVGRAAAAVLARRDVDVRLEAPVTEVRDGAVVIDGDDVVPFDVLLWTAGAAAPPLLRASGLSTDAAGFLLVDDTLRSIDDPRIFASGDAATLRSHPKTPKAGVFAVRQGPVLARNLAIACGGDGRRGGDDEHRPYGVYRPQRFWLALFNTGDGGAILSYGPVTLGGRWVMVLKDRIDRRFMRRFRRLGAGGAPG